MRVVYIVGQGEGGLPHYTAELANAVAAHDAVSEVLVLKPRQTDADGMFASRVDVLEPFRSLGITLSKLYRRSVDPVSVLRAVVSYREVKQIHDLDPDVVHDTTGLFPQVSLFVRYHGVDVGQPFVVTRHEVPERRIPLDRPPVLLERGVNALLPDVRTDASIVHTERQRETLLERGARPEAVHVIPHGVYSVFGTHDDVDVESEDDRLLFFGNVVPQKGVDTLVEAIPLIKRAVPDVTLVIAGDGKLSDRSRSIVEAHPESFERHDHFVPNEEVADLFASASVVVLPYRGQNGTKGHSGVLATAFAFGKPVVASSVGEFPELVADSGAGRVVPPGDPEQLAASIIDVLADDDAREEMVANSRRMIDQLSWERIADAHVELYERLRDGKRERSDPLPIEAE